MVSRSAASSRAVQPVPRRKCGWCWKPTDRFRSIWDRLRSDRGWRRSWRRSPPTRWRSEERRVGKGVDLGGRRIIKKKKKKKKTKAEKYKNNKKNKKTKNKTKTHT